MGSMAATRRFDDSSMEDGGDSRCIVGETMELQQEHQICKGRVLQICMRFYFLFVSFFLLFFRVTVPF